MSFAVIGIDPGHHGGIVILDGNGVPIYAINMPLAGSGFDYSEINKLFAKTKKAFPATKVAIELVGFMGVETAKNISDLIYHAGALFGIAVANDLPVFLTQPSVWKKKIGLPRIGITYAKKGETAEEKKKRTNENSRKRRNAKNISIEHAVRLMPQLEKVLGSKVNDGIAEAALIGEFARRTMSGIE